MLYVDDFQTSMVCDHCGMYCRFDSKCSKLNFAEFRDAFSRKVVEGIRAEVIKDPACSDFSPTYSVRYDLPFGVNAEEERELEQAIRQALLSSGDYTNLSIHVYGTIPGPKTYVECRLSKKGLKEASRLYRKKNHTVSNGVKDIFLGIFEVSPGCGCLMIMVILVTIFGFFFI